MIKFLATGFYIGYMPKFPGTFGTLLGIPLSYCLLLLEGTITYLAATMMFISLAILISELHDGTLAEDDSKTIVIDEVVGYLVAFAGMPFQWHWILFVFVLFRLFDGIKPFPINYIDKNIKGGMGIVLDDVVAGLITNIISQLVIHLIP